MNRMSFKKVTNQAKRGIVNVAKEVSHKLRALGFEHSGCDLRLLVEGRGAEGVIAALVVGSAIYHAGNLAPAECSGTHEARLHGDVEGAVGEIFTAKIGGCRGDSLHLGVGGDIGEGFGEIVRTGNDAALAHHHGTNGYLVALGGCAGFVEGGEHEALIIVLWGDILHIWVRG